MEISVLIFKSKMLSISPKIGSRVPMSVYVILEQEGYEVKYDKAKN